MKSEWSILRGAWGNGQRGLMIASMLFAAAMLLLMAAIVGSFCKDDPYAPLENVSPQVVVSVTPSTVTVAAVKCNHSARDVGTDGKIYWRNVDTQALVFEREAQGIRQPGCATIEYVNHIPAAVTAGTWRIEGVEIARAGHEEQREPWYTEPFTVEVGQHE